MDAQQEFAEILDDLKERCYDLLVICDGQYKQIAEANKILDNAPRNLGLEGEKWLQSLRASLSQEGIKHDEH